MRIPVARYCVGALLWLPAIPVCNAADSASPPSATSPAAQDLSWRMVGPFRGGRTRAVAGIPGRPDRVLIGAVNGGVWQTDDYGRTWTPIFDAEPT